MYLVNKQKKRFGYILPAAIFRVLSINTFVYLLRSLLHQNYAKSELGSTHNISYRTQSE